MSCASVNVGMFLLTLECFNNLNIGVIDVPEFATGITEVLGYDIFHHRV